MKPAKGLVNRLSIFETSSPDNDSSLKIFSKKGFYAIRRGGMMRQLLVH